MIFTPTGEIHLIQNHPFNNTYENVLDFENEEEQEDYFLEHVSRETLKAQFKPKESSLKIPINIEELWDINYLMYKSNQTGKWVYCFITDKNFISDKTTELLLEVDVYQTYMFDHTLKDSFIEREHQDRWSAQGVPIYNVAPDSLTLGDEYIKENVQTVAVSEQYYLVITSEKLESSTVYPEPNTIHHVPTPLFYYIVPRAKLDDDTMSAQDLCIILGDVSKMVSVSLLPFLTFDLSSCAPVLVTYEDAVRGTRNLTIFRITNNLPTRNTLGLVNKFNEITFPSLGVGIPRTIEHESKLLTYPYTYNLLSDNQCKPLVVKNEYLVGDLIEIGFTQGISHQPKIKYFVQTGYKGETDGKDNAVINSTINDIPLKSDAFKNYIQSNKASATTGIALSMGEAVVGTTLGIATGGIGLAVAGSSIIPTVSRVAGEIARQKDLIATPDTVRSMGNNIAFDVADGNTDVIFSRYSVHTDIKKIIADYFAMYGYKSMQVKTPNLRSRYYYNYIKTIGANIVGNMDVKDLDKLKSIYDNGVTIWHDRAGVTPYDYQYDNVEMSII